MSDGLLLLLLVGLPFFGSLCAGLLPTRARTAAAVVAGSVTIATSLITIWLFSETAGGASVDVRIAWVPALGIEFSVRMDGLAWLFSMLICGIGALVVIYARYYMAVEDPVPRFFSYLLAFMGAMLGKLFAGAA
eukprot:gene9787-12009_t